MYFPISDKEERFKLPNSSNVITSTGDDSNVLSFKYEPVTINSSSVELKIERKREIWSKKNNLRDFIVKDYIFFFKDIIRISMYQKRLGNAK